MTLGYIPRSLSSDALRDLGWQALSPDAEHPQTVHALFAPLPPGLSADDVIHVLEEEFTVARRSFSYDEWRYRYEVDGPSVDGEPITIVLEVDTLRREFIVAARWRIAE